jgi:hypothetical protein
MRAHAHADSADSVCVFLSLYWRSVPFALFAKECACALFLSSGLILFFIEKMPRCLFLGGAAQSEQ